MREWKECKLGDVIDIKHGYAFKGAFFSDEQTENVLVTPGNFQIGGGFKSNKLKFYNGEVPTDYILQTNDIIVTMTDLSKEADTLGYSAVVPEITGKKLLHNQRLGRVTCKSNSANIMFINWLLRTEEYRWHIIGSASGSTVSHTSPSRILEYQFLLPPLPEQRSIAGVLSSLDDKIDLLHRQNKTLEGMAASLWRKMFLEDADPVWKKIKLGDIVSVSTGKGLKRIEYNENGLYPIIGANGEIGRTDKYLTNEKLILTGRVGTLGEIVISNREVWISDNVLIIKPNEDRFFYAVYFLLKNMDFENLNVGSTQPLLTQTDLKNIEIELPSNDILDYFVTWCESGFNKIEKNVSQIGTLKKLRDKLLPKLMSGEVRAEVIK